MQIKKKKIKKYIPTTKGLLFAVLLGFALVAIVTFIANILNMPGNGYVTKETSYISIVVIFPVFEELIFRKFLFRYVIMQKLYVPAIYAGIITGITFAFFHEPVTVMIWAFIFSCICCYIYYCSKTIILSIVTHISFNGFSLLLSQMPSHLYNTTIIMLGVFSFVVVIIGIIIIKTKGKTQLIAMKKHLSKETQYDVAASIKSFVLSPFKKEITDWKVLKKEMDEIRGK